MIWPQATDALVGPPTGPFRRLIPPKTCATSFATAVDEAFAAYVDPDCPHDRVRIVVRDVVHRGRPLVVRDAPASGGCCSQVALARRFVAWNQGHRGDGTREVVVYDRLARRAAYRAVIRPAAGSLVELGFDLQPDGKIAVAYRLLSADVQTGPTTVAWFSPSEPHAHIRIRGRTTLVRVARDRMAVERFLTSRRSALEVTDLSGRVQSVARFARPARLRTSFDFDGQRIVWASDLITATRVDCPPPGQGRPCVRRETGVTKIWLRNSITGPTHLVARLPFDDTIAQP